MHSETGKVKIYECMYALFTCFVSPLCAFNISKAEAVNCRYCRYAHIFSCMSSEIFRMMLLCVLKCKTGTGTGLDGW